MQRFLAWLFLAIVSGAPLVYRLCGQGLTEPVGLLSDAITGLLFLHLALLAPHWLRIGMAVLWTLFHLAAHELLAAMQRLPTWRDIQYLTDPDFVANSVAGFNLASPWITLLAVAGTIAVVFAPVGRISWKRLRWSLVLIPLLAGLHGLAGFRFDEQGVAARYSPLHWFALDAAAGLARDNAAQRPVPLPAGLDELDLTGAPLVTGGKAKNVLILVLEGIPGMYHSAIGTAMGMRDKDSEMPKLTAATREAMLVPDFTVHSHQTIRGLYSLLCGDYSKLSWDTPKAMELQSNPARAQECLPAQLAAHGWSTHFLQAANLGFMSKDRVMPLIGFQQVHGNEWFSEANPFPFDWGVVDTVFLRGARKYIAGLQAKNAPWMLTLLTVGTHQPYAVPDEVAERYPSRRQATVALLDQAVADFLAALRRDGVLKDTLVILTSDESHGSALADWISSWGLAVVLAPEQRQLPRFKQGGYGLVDITASVLDYFHLSPPPSIIGRSFFREYNTPREMVSYTTSTRRWHTGGNLRYECADDGRCRVGVAPSLLGEPPEDFPLLENETEPNLFAITATLDRKLQADPGRTVLHFANGEVRRLPERLASEYADNLIGAQYLDFPAKSKVRVYIRYKAVETPETGIQLKLLLKQWEFAQDDIAVPEFPVLYAGEEATVEFDFDNPEARQSFSFHLLGEGVGAVIQMEEFSVMVNQGRS